MQQHFLGPGAFPGNGAGNEGVVEAKIVDVVVVASAPVAVGFDTWGRGNRGRTGIQAEHSGNWGVQSELHQF